MFITPNRQNYCYFMVVMIYFQWNDDDVSFVLDQHTKLHLHSATIVSSTSQSRHVAPLGHIIVIPSRLVFDLTPLCYVLSRCGNKYYFHSIWFHPTEARTHNLEASHYAIFVKWKKITVSKGINIIFWRTPFSVPTTCNMILFGDTLVYHLNFVIFKCIVIKVWIGIFKSKKDRQYNNQRRIDNTMAKEG